MNDLIAPASSSFTFDRARFVVLHIKDGVQLGDLQDIVNFLGQVKQLEVAALFAHRREGTDQLGNAGAVDVVIVLGEGSVILKDVVRELLSKGQTKMRPLQSTMVTSLARRVLVFMLTGNLLESAGCRTAFDHRPLNFIAGGHTTCLCRKSHQSRAYMQGRGACAPVGHEIFYTSPLPRLTDSCVSSPLRLRFRDTHAKLLPPLARSDTSGRFYSLSRKGNFSSECHALSSSCLRLPDLRVSDQSWR